MLFALLLLAQAKPAVGPVLMPATKSNTEVPYVNSNPCTQSTATTSLSSFIVHENDRMNVLTFSAKGSTLGEHTAPGHAAPNLPILTHKSPS